MKWTEGHIHVVMRDVLRQKGWTLVAGEFPGGSDHELYPLNVVDPVVARDASPDPRRHSLGELIPDLVALRGANLFVGEAKVQRTGILHYICENSRNVFQTNNSVSQILPVS